MITLDVKAIPDWMIISSFRYALGRMTYVVGEVSGWLVDNWEDLNPEPKEIIAKELAEAFQRDHSVRRYEIKSGLRSSSYPLGMDCDRAEWRKLLDVAHGIYCVDCGMPEHLCLCSHDD